MAAVEDGSEDAIEQIGGREKGSGLPPAPPPPPPNGGGGGGGTVPISRMQFAEFLQEERARVESCSTLPCTLIIWVLFVTIVWMHGNVNSIHRLRTCIYEAVHGMEVPYINPGSDVERILTLDDLQDTSEVWAWLSQGYVLALGAPPDGGPPVVRTFNHVLGEALIRQRRVLPTKCRVNEELSKFYGQDCYNKGGDDDLEPFGIMPIAAQNPSFIAGGGISSDDTSDAAKANANMFVTFLDLTRDKDNGMVRGQMQLATLYNGGWIDDSTVLVEVHTALFNGEVGALVHVQVDFTFNRGGLVSKNLIVRPIDAVVFPSTVYMVLDMIWALLMVAIFLGALQAWSDSKRPGIFNSLFGDWWLLIDWVGSIVGGGLIGFLALYGGRLSELTDRIGRLPPQAPPRADYLPRNATAMSRLNAVEGVRAYHVEFSEVVQDLEWLAYIKILHRLGMFWYVVVIMCRFFRGFAGQPRIATIGRTIGQASLDLIHLAIIIVVVFGNFVLGGCVLFGAELEEWSSFTKSMRTTISVVFGRGNYEEMYSIAPLSSMFWLFSFVFSMVFILQNLLLAIVIDYHVEVQSKSGGAEAESVIKQIKMMGTDFWWSISYSFRVVWRFAYARVPDYIRKRMHEFPDEPARVAKIPYDILLANSGVEGYDDVEGMNVQDREQPGWHWIDMDFLIRANVDESTADRLFLKCRAWAATRTPDTYPPEKLVAEFEGAMTRSYGDIDLFNDEIRQWISEKMVDIQNIEPRQKRFQAMTQMIVPNPPTPRQWDSYQTGYGQYDGYEQTEGEPLLADGPESNMGVLGDDGQPAIWPGVLDDDGGH
eukprot:TRINITY_DN75193_c0_g1_i1.p1 TRINITY_DN75193_c0_g1~~TRINITY_DN75193_c0_g1_i1.p1  ORF type:complete len:822 (+),score=181.25 TRINITY_DN75193_c0_g1_i1:127-2592(+)